MSFVLLEHYMPPNPHRAFQAFTGTALPENPKNFQWDYYKFTGFDSYVSMSLYMETSPAEVNRLIREMDLTFLMSHSEWASRREDRPFGREKDQFFLESPYEFSSSLENGPDIQKWKGAVKFQKTAHQAEYSLITSEAKTKVYIKIYIYW